MKQIFSLFSICLLVAFSGGCKKSDSNKTDLFSDSIAGTWELRQASAAMNPIVSNLPAGNGHILKFTGTAYEKYEAGQLVQKGQYSIVADPTVESSVCLLFPVGQFTNRIVYDADNGEKQFMQISNNRLIIVAGCYAIDAGHRMEYERIAQPDKN